MDPATKVKIAGALWTAVLPLGAAAAVAFGGRKLRLPGGTAATLALLAGYSVAWLGINGGPGLPPQDADGWILYAALTAGLLGLGLDRIPGAARGLAGAGLVAAGLLGFTWRLLAPLALWDDGLIGPLARDAWLADALILAGILWLSLDHAQQKAEGPVILGPLALAMGAGAVAIALGGSARIGQSLGALALVTGAVGLLAWRWPGLRPGAGGVGAATLAFALLLIYARFYVDLPRPGLALILAAPLGAIVAARQAATLPAVVLGLLLAAAPAGLGAWLTHAAQQPTAAPAGGDGADDDSYLPY